MGVLPLPGNGCLLMASLVGSWLGPERMSLMWFPLIRACFFVAMVLHHHSFGTSWELICVYGPTDHSLSLAFLADTTKHRLFCDGPLVSPKTGFRHRKWRGDVFWPSPPPSLKHHHRKLNLDSTTFSVMQDRVLGDEPTFATNGHFR